MNGTRSCQQSHPDPLRTTLLQLVWSLTERGMEPDEIVQYVRRGLESGGIVLTGNFRDGLFTRASPGRQRGLTGRAPAPAADRG